MFFVSNIYTLIILSLLLISVFLDIYLFVKNFKKSIDILNGRYSPEYDGDSCDKQHKRFIKILKDSRNSFVIYLFVSLFIFTLFDSNYILLVSVILVLFTGLLKYLFFAFVSKSFNKLMRS